MIKDKLRTKFNVDLLWNIVSFGMSAIIGVLINIIIIKYYDSSVLGVFNQIYAIYIILSQLAVGGVHLSVQKFIPEEVGNKGNSDSILLSALGLTTITSVVVMMFAYFLQKVPGGILQSDGVTEGFVFVVWGLIFFSFNKVLLAYHNGFRRMKAFAAFQLLRFLLMLVFLLGFIELGIDSNKLAIILALSEVVLFVSLMLYSLQFISLSNNSDLVIWLKRNFHFGNKSFFGNFLLDLNTRVDVFVLGVFLTDTTVGVYSFVALIVEGFLQLSTLLRNNINPIITKCYKTKSIPVLEKFLKMNVKAFYKMQVPLALFAVFVFPVFLLVIGMNESFYEMWALFAILILGVAIASGYIPFLMIFNQLGFPEKHTLFISLLFISNLVFNFIFIPLIGIYGAAVGTSLSFVLLMVFEKRILFSLLKVNI